MVKWSMRMKPSCELVQGAALSQESTLMPRLCHAADLVAQAIVELECLHKDATQRSKKIDSKQQRVDSSVLVNAVSDERLIALASESARTAYIELCRTGDMRKLAKALPSVIPVIRAAGSQSHVLAPDSSAMLCEAACILGSVAIDAALIAGTKIRYDECIHRSADTLERAKLIVDSKLSELYPKLDFVRLGSTWA